MHADILYKLYILYLNVKYYENFPLFLKSKFINFFINNTDKWVVQSNFVKNSLCNCWDIKLNNVLILLNYKINELK